MHIYFHSQENTAPLWWKMASLTEVTRGEINCFVQKFINFEKYRSGGFMLHVRDADLCLIPVTYTEERINFFI
jgi:hypothetical protein